MKRTGLYGYRFDDNPEERRFAEAWDQCFGVWSAMGNHVHVLDSLMSPEGYPEARPKQATKRDHLVAATVVQWLGSPVGQCFLRDLGYNKVLSDPPPESMTQDMAPQSISKCP